MEGRSEDSVEFGEYRWASSVIVFSSINCLVVGGAKVECGVERGRNKF